MAHKIDNSTGEYAYLEIGGRLTAWHGLGRALKPERLAALSPAEQIRVVMGAARLDWSVEPFDVFGEHHELIRGWKAFRRTDTGHLMGVFPESYTPLQNGELFALALPLLDAGVVEFETAGALRDGEDVWLLLRFNPKDSAVTDWFGEQEIRPYALLADNHARKRQVVIMETMIRVVCANTLGSALSRLPGAGRRAGRFRNAISVRHTGNVTTRSAEAVDELWGALTQSYAAIRLSYKALMRRRLTPIEFTRSVLEPLAPLPKPGDYPGAERALERAWRRRTVLRNLYEGDAAGTDGEPTAWNAYMAASEAVDHHPELFPIRSRDRLRGLFPGGSLAEKKQRVLNRLHALAVRA